MSALEPPTGSVPTRLSSGPADASPTPPPSRGRRAAWIVAIAADVLQWVIAPLVAAGGASIPDDIIDVVVAGLLIKLLGWHWAFAPSFVVKLIPVADFVPTWTMAVWIATRGSKRG
jgi:hypothetical protein